MLPKSLTEKRQTAAAIAKNMWHCGVLQVQQVALKTCKGRRLNEKNRPKSCKGIV